MGLREQKAQRTRTAIADAALDLFERQGYDATPMEQIAEAAQVSPSTLYRYFPTKDATLLDHPGMDLASLSAELGRRPADEPLAEALGAAVRAALEQADAHADQLLRLRRQLDVTPVARARLWDLWHAQRTRLEDAIAARAGVPAGTLWVQLSAHTCLLVVQMALDRVRATPTPGSAVAHAAEVMAGLAGPDVVLPRLPEASDALDPTSRTTTRRPADDPGPQGRA